MAGSEVQFPALAASIVLRHDRVRGGDVLVMPERIVVLNEQAASILRLCDGSRSLDQIVGEVAELFPGEDVKSDVVEFLGQVSEQGWLR